MIFDPFPDFGSHPVQRGVLQQLLMSTTRWPISNNSTVGSEYLFKASALISRFLLFLKGSTGFCRVHASPVRSEAFHRFVPVLLGPLPVDQDGPVLPASISRARWIRYFSHHVCYLRGRTECPSQRLAPITHPTGPAACVCRRGWRRRLQLWCGFARRRRRRP